MFNYLLYIFRRCRLISTYTVVYVQWIPTPATEVKICSLFKLKCVQEIWFSFKILCLFITCSCNMLTTCGLKCSMCCKKAGGCCICCILWPQKHAITFTALRSHLKINQSLSILSRAKRGNNICEKLKAYKGGCDMTSSFFVSSPTSGSSS